MHGALGGGERLIVLTTAAVAPPHGPREQHLAGRAAAADALRRADSTELEVGRRPDGAPDFPPGFVGSIAHTRQLAIAAVCRAEEVRGIGVDLETDVVQLQLHRILLRERERETLWTPPDEATLRGLFAAKEAAFKAFSASEQPVVRMFWRIGLERPDPKADWLLARAADERAWVRVRADGEKAVAVAVLMRPGQEPASGEPPVGLRIDMAATAWP